MMVLLSLKNEHWRELVEEHRAWLSKFAAPYGSKWEKSFRADRQSAMNEASVRRLLQSQRIFVEPYEGLTNERRSPDFRCVAASGHFYVEAACVLESTATRRTKIDQRESGFRPFDTRGMNKKIVSICNKKARQCANLDAPALVAIGTFHFSAGVITLEKPLLNSLLVPTKIGWTIDPRTGCQVGDSYLTTDLEGTPFDQRISAGHVNAIRKPISGLLLCNVSTSPIQCRGILNPNAVRAFDPTMLPRIEFGSREFDGRSKAFRIAWRSADGSVDQSRPRQ